MSGQRRFVRRVALLTVFAWVALGVILMRVGQLQLVQHPHLAKMARDAYLADVKVPARRGHIYDRRGQPLAISVDVPSIYANPMELDDPRPVARALQPLLGVSVDTLYRRLASDRLFVWLKRHVTPEVASQVSELGVSGLGVVQESRRYYPNRESGAHVLGFSGVDTKGLEGIEKSLDPHLTGEPQVVEALRDARGRAVLGRDVDRGEPGRGADVWLTIDLQLQHAMEVALREAVATQEASGGVAVALEVETAEVLGMAVEPHFNPNRASSARPSHRRNRALTDMFEPGSALKPLVVAAALDAATIAPSDRLFCEKGALRIGAHTIRDTQAHGWLTVEEVLQKSSNICAAKIGQSLGPVAMHQSLRALGFGARTGVRFPGETPGLLRDPQRWSDVGLATIAFGHGIAVNALQLAAAYRVIAAQGDYLAPKMIRRLDAVRGAPQLPERRPRRVMRAETTATVTRMLEAAVSREGTGWLAQVPGYRVAGKTGTAHKPDALVGGYSAQDFMAVFAGFAPVPKPRVVVVVAIDEPRRQHSGGAVAAPVFSRIVAAAMGRLGVAPTEKVNENVQAALGRVTSLLDEPIVPVDAPAPAPGTVPSFIGLTAREAVQRYVQSGASFALSLEGSGRVRGQDPAAGSRDARRVRLRLGARLGER